MSQVGRQDLLCRIGNPGNYHRWYKEEFFLRDPRISLIHDAVTDRESEVIKELAAPKVRTLNLQSFAAGPCHTIRTPQKLQI